MMMEHVYGVYALLNVPFLAHAYAAIDKLRRL